MKRLNVIVCGSTFGEYYVRAIQKNTDKFNLTGLLAKGSARSHRLSEKYNIPLYSNIESLPKDTDVACVIIRSEGAGGQGTLICNKLIQRGIHVIQEQPTHSIYLKESYRLARINDVIYMTSNLYNHLPAIETFKLYNEKLKSLSKLEYVNLSFSTQVSYTVFDIISKLGMHGKLSLNKKVIKNEGPFDIISVRLDELPILIEFNNRINPNHSDKNMSIMYNFRFYYEDGILSLEDIFGPVTWRPRKYIESRDSVSEVENQLPFQIIYSNDLNMEECFEETWTTAILKELEEMYHYIAQGCINQQRANGEIAAAINWETLSEFAGYAELVDTYRECEVILDTFRNNVRRIKCKKLKNW